MNTLITIIATVLSVIGILSLTFPAFRSILIPYKTHFKTGISIITVSLFLTSCGGEPTPKYLEKLRVDVSKWTPTIEVVVKKESLGHVEAILPLQDSTEFLIVSGNQVNMLSNYKLKPNNKDITPGLWHLSIARNSSAEPSHIIGNGGWGKPSVAVFDINGQLKWMKEYNYDAMGLPAVLDDNDKRFIVLEKGKNLLYFNFETGEIVRKGSPVRIIGSADFTDDGQHEIFVGLGEDDFAVMNAKEQILSRLTVSNDYWYEPVLTSDILPFVVLSAREKLEVYDSNLKIVKKYKAAGAGSKMHVVTATFIGNDPDAPFAAVYEGRGGWDRSILYVFSSTGELVYKEILKGFYSGITAVPSNDKNTILIGGGNKVIRYSFQK